MQWIFWTPKSDTGGTTNQFCMIRHEKTCLDQSGSPWARTLDICQ